MTLSFSKKTTNKMVTATLKMPPTPSPR